MAFSLLGAFLVLSVFSINTAVATSLGACPINDCDSQFTQYSTVPDASVDDATYNFVPCAVRYSPAEYTCIESTTPIVVPPSAAGLNETISFRQCCCCTHLVPDTDVEHTRFVGLDGRRFVFPGQPGAIVNLLTEQAHQVNAQFVEGYHFVGAENIQSEMGTYMGVIAVQAFNTTVQTSSDENGVMSVVVNGEPVTNLTGKRDGKEAFTFAPDVNVTVQLQRPGLGQAVAIETPLMELIVYVTPPDYDEATSQTARAHLNFILTINTTVWRASTMHGIIGQTTPDRSPDLSDMPEDAQSQWLGEGVPEDYLVSSLLGTDCRFNKFVGNSDRLSVIQRAARKFLQHGSSAASAFVGTALGGKF